MHILVKFTSYLQRVQASRPSAHVWSFCGRTCYLTGQDMAVHIHCGTHHHLWRHKVSLNLFVCMQNHICLVMCIPPKSPHVSGIPCIFQTVLITLEKEFQEKSAKRKTETLFKRLKHNENSQGQQHSYVNSRQ